MRNRNKRGAVPPPQPNQPTALPEPLPEFLTREQASAFFGRSVDYLKRRGLIQPIVAPIGRGRGGKRTYYTTADCRRVRDELAKFEIVPGGA